MKFYSFGEKKKLFNNDPYAGFPPHIETHTDQPLGVGGWFCMSQLRRSVC